MNRLLGAAAILIAATAAATAGDFKPLEGRSIELGGLNGVAYYTVADGGYDVVATLVGAEGSPVRVSTRLADGQSLTLMVPESVGSAPQAVDIRRDGTTVLIAPSTVAMN
ncbi:hypothetical protein [Aurantimonas sp. HBX-1]|uniref:hypothetical protein n=1 Tax=Aurantimonas sp. HBX-1 TaxID=2906072 RepID=UPI001F24A3FA|nr:hypothetical protein [Aurantimonas sp. HBX-1]UIJ72141.1 hypothetical protein LXB15_00235 [Aurantimonas sp. HBX-1]